MRAITHKVHGALYERNRRLALLLQEPGSALYLRFPFVTQGPEEPVFPAFILDDWGDERRTLELYQWTYEEGHRFPRANLFGFEADGRETQLFLRELELYFKYPCYVFPRRNAPVTGGARLNTILLPDPDYAGKPEKVVPPAALPWPFRRAAVRWRRVNPADLAAHGYESTTL